MRTLDYFILSPLFFVAALSCGPLAQAESLPLVFVQKLTSAKTISVNKNAEFFKLKILQNEKKWGPCAQSAQKVWGHLPAMQPWILNTWLQCATEAESIPQQVQVLKTLDTKPEFFLQGPARNSLFKRMVILRKNLIQEAPESIREQQIQKLFEAYDRLDKDTKAWLYLELAQTAWDQKKNSQAEYFCQLSLGEKESKAAGDLSSKIAKFQGKSAAAVVPPAHRQESPETPESPESPESSVRTTSEEEIKFEKRFAQSLQATDALAYSQDAVEYLSALPNGKWVTSVSGKMFDLLVSINDPKTQEKFKSFRERLLLNAAQVDPVRSIDWLKSLHRRSDFDLTANLATQILERNKTSPLLSTALYLGGRSYQFLGQYKKAEILFEKYVAFHSGGEDFQEVLFRLGLCHFRQEQFSSAIATFERLLNMKNADRYELSARYWLVRSLQKTKNDRSVTERDQIIGRYPFSYYGIRLRAEKEDNVYQWPESMKAPLTLKGNLYLTSYQKKIWDRIHFLSQNEWFDEAQSEIVDLPIPKIPQIRALVSMELYASQAFPTIIRFINEASDQAPELRSLDLIRLSFPKIFSNLIEQESARSELHPLLVKSLIRQESAFGVKAISTSQALGLMQLIPPTALEVSQELKLQGVQIPEDVYRPATNIKMGTYYIGKMIRQFGGSVPLGLAAYNAGPTRMGFFTKARPDVFSDAKRFSSEPSDEMWFDELPWYETSFYVKAILRNSILYRVLDEGRVRLNHVLWRDLIQFKTEVPKTMGNGQ